MRLFCVERALLDLITLQWQLKRKKRKVEDSVGGTATCNGIGIGINTINTTLGKSAEDGDETRGEERRGEERRGEERRGEERI